MPTILDISGLDDVTFVLKKGLLDVRYELYIDEPNKYIRPFSISYPGFLLVTNQAFDIFSESGAATKNESKTPPTPPSPPKKSPIIKGAEVNGGEPIPGTTELAEDEEGDIKNPTDE
jgi:hypothetical protein